VALLNFGTQKFPWGHFVVVTGATDDGVYVNSGLKEAQFIRAGKFDGAWRKTNRWMLVVSPQEAP
jgi:hypothetical protein